MKEGRLSSGPSLVVTSSCSGDLSLAHLSMAPWSAISWVGAAPVAQFSSGPSCGQGRRGACRSKRLIGGQHVPDRFAQAPADLDRGDLRASLATVAGAHPLANRLIGGVAGGAVRCLDESPAQVIGPVLAQRPAPVALAGLLDPWAEAGVADQLGRARKAADLADLGGDREGEHPADPRTGHEQRDVPVLGAEGSQLALAARDPLVEQVDQLEARRDRRRPGLGRLEPAEQRPAAGAEEIAARAGDAVLEEDRVDPVLERRTVLDEVQPEARPLPL